MVLKDSDHAGVSSLFWIFLFDYYWAFAITHDLEKGNVSRIMKFKNISAWVY